MTSADHPDPVALLRYALWGATDGAAGVRSHAEACAACREEIADLRRARDALRVLEARGPSPGAEAAAEAAARAAADPEVADFEWLRAVPASPLVAVRGGETDPCDRLLRCDAGDVRVDALLGPSAVPGHVSLSGQVVRDGQEPAADIDVTLFLDRRPAGVVRTDRFGEFATDVRRAGRIGLRVPGRAGPRHVELDGGSAAP